MKVKASKRQGRGGNPPLPLYRTCDGGSASTSQWSSDKTRPFQFSRQNGHIKTVEKGNGPDLWTKGKWNLYTKIEKATTKKNRAELWFHGPQ
jgi:hypothetical protein